ncbi:hypothetical protein EHQ46_18370 [Leptospira yanagawae]|uniref:Glycosyltransferase RgtA/B/C/D-like domain-containing protein n=1 Tax=Leptospira yanagawae TaxID=293069 RepID=A0ABY2LWQ1_9LEPT|nr:hypothetical protein [Leptospira yanagawae]TGL16479.1 hypothetical protein EHQ46_18370 [Leptospira yanagawae]
MKQSVLKIMNRPELQVSFFFVVSVCVFYGLNVPNFFGEFYFLTDLAANDFQIMEILRGKLGYGAYSRFQFNHPGPMYFYLLAFAESVFLFFESEYARYAFVTFLLNATCVGVSLFLIAKQYKSYLSGILLFVFFLFVTKSLGFQFFFETWTPYVMVCPFLLYVISIIKVVEKQWMFLPIFFLLGSILFQLNIMGAVPFGIGFLFIVYHFYRWQRNGEMNEKKQLGFHLGLSSLVLLIVWLPVLVDFFVNFPGNISNVLLYLVKGGGNKKPFEVIKFLNGTFGQIVSIPYAVFLYLIIVLLPYWKRFPMDSFTVKLRNFTSIYTMITLLTLFRMKGPIVPHLFWHFFAVIALQILLCFRFFPWKEIPTKRNFGLVAFSTISTVFLVLSFGKVPPKEHNLHVKEISELVMDQNDRFILHWEMNERDFSQGNLVLGIASRLNRIGKKVCLLEPWLFLVPKSYHCVEKESKEATLLLFETAPSRFPKLEMANQEIHFEDSIIKLIQPKP